MDDALSEFARFYLERREQEARAAGGDERKRKKLQDEFTPRLEMTLVGLEGTVHREVKVRAYYAFDSEPGYEHVITVIPHSGQVKDFPELAVCSKSGRTVPRDCLAACEVSGAQVLRHLLVKSDMTGRLALPEFSVTCTVSGKRVLKDEAELSASRES